MVLDRKIVFVDLTKETVRVSPVSLEVRKKYLGGRGINMFLLSRTYSADLDPLSQDNPLIFGAGLLTGALQIRKEARAGKERGRSIGI